MSYYPSKSTHNQYVYAWWHSVVLLMMEIDCLTFELDSFWWELTVDSPSRSLTKSITFHNETRALFPTCIIGSMITAKETGIAIVAIVAIFIGYCIIAFTVKVLRSCFPSFEHEETQPLRPQTRYSNPNNNHDHLKFKHSTRASAEAEVGRMKEARYDECGHLKVYYNRDLEGWFVGRGWRRWGGMSETGSIFNIVTDEIYFSLHVQHKKRVFNCMRNVYNASYVAF